MRALALYLLLTRQSVNIGCIIFVDIDEMAQITTKNSLGHDFVILLLCRKAGVDELTNGCITNLTRALDAAWIFHHPMRAT